MKLKVSEYRKWALLLVLVSILDSVTTLVVLKSGGWAEQGILSKYLLRSGGIRMFCFTRTSLVLYMLMLSEVGLLSHTTSPETCCRFYKSTVMLYVFLYICGIIVVHFFLVEYEWLERFMTGAWHGFWFWLAT